MPRPSVSVVVPFAGDRPDAEAVVERFRGLRLREGDALVLADNSPAPVLAELPLPVDWRVVPAPGEASPARARNAGAGGCSTEWLLFVDSDCRPAPDLLDTYFATAPADDVGLVAGRVAPAGDERSVAVRWAASRRLLDQNDALAGRMPWAHTANLLVRRRVFAELGGFLEGIRNAEDVDFCWRATAGGWRLIGNDDAAVGHEHRETIRGLYRQRVVSVASSVWVRRRWPDAPPPAPTAGRDLLRALVLAPLFTLTGQFERGRFKVIDGVVAAASVRGRHASNRARSLVAPGPARRRPVIITCDEFPVLSETFVVQEARALAALGHPVEVLALRRPARAALGIHDLRVRYVEDDTRWERARALGRLALRHPGGVLRDRRDRRRWAREEPVPPLRELAPAALRLAAQPGALLHVHFAAGASLAALRISRITQRPWTLTAHAYDIYLLPRNLPEKLQAASLVTSGCDYTVRDLRVLAGSAADRVHRVVMGIDPDAFHRTRPRSERRVVVAIGRLVEKKGFVHLIRAAARPELREHLDGVVIVGEGPLRDELAAEIAALGLTEVVTLAGAQQQDAIRGLIEESAVLAMPCVVAANGDRDSMPVVVKEALAMEVPVVVSDEVGLPELARPAFARLVAPADPAALADALAELLQLPVAERERMGTAGRAFVVEHANARTETARLSELLEAVPPGVAG